MHLPDPKPYPRLAHIIWPGTYFATFYLTHVLILNDWDAMTAMMSATIALAVALLIAEHVVPMRKDWQAPDGQLLADIGHLVGFSLGTSVATWCALACLAVCGEWMNAKVGLWPTGWPMPAQFLLALVLGDVANYWQHRLLHGNPLLWRLHKIHHQPRRLVLVKTTRIHMLDIATGTFLVLMPAAVFGASVTLMAWLTLFTNVSALLQHVNLHLPTVGQLDTIFSTPKNHRGHHSRDVIPGNRNFSMNLMLCDHLFGTFWKASGDTPEHVGLDGDDGSEPFWSQFLAVFRR